MKLKTRRVYSWSTWFLKGYWRRQLALTLIRLLVHFNVVFHLQYAFPCDLGWMEIPGISQDVCFSLVMFLVHHLNKSKPSCLLLRGRLCFCICWICRKSSFRWWIDIIETILRNLLRWKSIDWRLTVIKNVTVWKQEEPWCIKFASTKNRSRFWEEEVFW